MKAARGKRSAAAERQGVGRGRREEVVVGDGGGGVVVAAGEGADGVGQLSVLSEQALRGGAALGGVVVVARRQRAAVGVVAQTRLGRRCSQRVGGQRREDLRGMTLEE